MAPGQTDALFIRAFQIQVHHLLRDGLTFRRDALVKEHLVFNLRHGGSFDCRGMGDNGIQIELTVIYLRVDTEPPILRYQVNDFINCWHYLTTFLRKDRLFLLLFQIFFLLFFAFITIMHALPSALGPGSLLPSSCRYWCRQCSTRGSPSVKGLSSRPYSSG